MESVHPSAFASRGWLHVLRRLWYVAFLLLGTFPRSSGSLLHSAGLASWPRGSFRPRLFMLLSGDERAWLGTWPANPVACELEYVSRVQLARLFGLLARGLRRLVAVPRCATCTN